MRVDNIKKMVEEMVGVVKKHIELTTIDRDMIREQMRDIIIDTFRQTNFSGLIRDEIKNAMRTVDVVHANVKTEEVIQHKIVTRNRESEELNAKMRELSDSIVRLAKQVQEFQYEEKVSKAIKDATKDVRVNNAIVTNVDVTNCNIKEEDVIVPVPKTEERLEIIEKPYEVKIPRLKDEIHIVKKVVFPDGKEAF